jgi:hypothetical protein
MYQGFPVVPSPPRRHNPPAGQSRTARAVLRICLLDQHSHKSGAWRFIRLATPTRADKSPASSAPLNRAAEAALRESRPRARAGRRSGHRVRLRGPVRSHGNRTLSRAACGRSVRGEGCGGPIGGAAGEPSRVGAVRRDGRALGDPIPDDQGGRGGRVRPGAGVRADRGRGRRPAAAGAAPMGRGRGPTDVAARALAPAGRLRGDRDHGAVGPAVGCRAAHHQLDDRAAHRGHADHRGAGRPPYGRCGAARPRTLGRPRDRTRGRGRARSACDGRREPVGDRRGAAGRGLLRDGTDHRRACPPFR